MTNAPARPAHALGLPATASLPAPDPFIANLDAHDDMLIVEKPLCRGE